MIGVNRKGEVWVFIEQHDGQIEEPSLELMSKARHLADLLGVKLGAMLVGDKVRQLAEKIIYYGADKVYLAESAACCDSAPARRAGGLVRRSASEGGLLAKYQTNSYAKVICGLIGRYEPQIVLYGATAVGRDLAPRIASAIKAGLTADCTDLQIGDHQPANSDIVHKNLLFQVRPAFGGNIIATIINYDRWPQMATVREGVMLMPEPDTKRKGQIIEEIVQLSDSDLPIEILEEQKRAKKVNLKAARIIVAGGAGVGSRQNFKLVWDLANSLGAAPAGTRAAVDLGFIDKEYQVGQTGTTVRPSLYIAVGISGAIQHQAGMNQSQKIVAINNDADAAIFQVAHYKIIGDLNVVVPKMIKALHEKGIK